MSDLLKSLGMICTTVIIIAIILRLSSRDLAQGLLLF